MASIRYRSRGKHKLWQFEIRDEIGKTVVSQSGFSTKKEAQLMGTPILQEILQGSILNKDMTLPQLYQKWFDLKIKHSKLSSETIDHYLYYKKLLEKYFSKQSISKIKTSDYQLALNKIGNSIGRDMLGRLNSVVKKSILFAQQDKLMIDDFAIGAELFSKKEVKPIESKFIHSEENYENLVCTIKSQFDYNKSIVPYVIYFLLKTGMRYAELVALTWEEINFSEGVIYTYRRYNTKKHLFIPPKNKTSVRFIPINDECINILKQLKNKQEHFNQSLGVNNTQNLVFQHYGLSDSIPHSATTNKAIKKILIELGIPIITNYGCRHTYGSILLHRGIPIDIVAKIMGHKDRRQLIETYGHLLKEAISQEFLEVKKIL
ncbi:site-specific integrase [Lactococcus lactis]|uniref:site-specific integrase n=1 Tax=Lactococcus lactis TaxID=1358 RepID=UPI000BF40CC6|nr:site-specific integrase [Lactococcus lactis]PFG75753.1 site-specific integrase [Lactococcus lactis]